MRTPRKTIERIPAVELMVLACAYLMIAAVAVGLLH